MIIQSHRTFFLYQNLSETDRWRAKFEKDWRERVVIPVGTIYPELDGIMLCPREWWE